jgi:C-terminal processing protease CtpA/Prc
MNAQKTLALFLSILLTLSLVSQTAHAQTTANASAEDARIARLAGLAKVWGTVKYFHPFLAYRDIDWDKALVEAIPRVNNAKTPQDYQSAINQMLAVLNDKSTHADIEAQTNTKPAAPIAPDISKLVRTENGILIVEVTQIVQAISADNTARNRILTSINEAAEKASGIVINARGATNPTELERYYFPVYLKQILTGMLDTTVVLGSARYRMHSGYATQINAGADDYYSAFVTAAPQQLAGRRKTKTPPIVFIVNQSSPSFTDILSGLQTAKRAFVVQEGEQAPETGSGSFKMDLPDHVQVSMRTLELINPDGSMGVQADAVVAKSSNHDMALKEAIQAVQENKVSQRPNQSPAPFMPQTTQKDNPYAEMAFPNVEYRLLALFRYWNVINYFFPYKNLIGDSWKSVLQRYIPKFEANKDSVDYQLTVRELVGEMHDSHGVLRNTTAGNEKLGMFMPPIMTAYVEDKFVVKSVLDDKLPVKVGDVILTVDGEPVEKKREALERYVASSTPQYTMKLVSARMPLGPKDSVLKMKVQAPGGAVRDVELTRSESVMDPKWNKLMERTSPVIQVLPSGYGYVDLDRLQVGEVDKVFDTIKDTPAVILDMRGYPNGTAWAIAPRLTDKGNVVAARFSRPVLEATSLGNPELAESANYSFSQKMPDREGDQYKGKVVVLINEDAISQAEHSCLFFEVATNVTFIGTPTAGANGDITYMVLPGNLTVSFSGHDVRHADGRQLQRVGIQPTIKVAPTIRGLVDGRDEILEAAVKYLQTSLKSTSTAAKP